MYLLAVHHTHLADRGRSCVATRTATQSGHPTACTPARCRTTGPCPALAPSPSHSPLCDWTLQRWHDMFWMLCFRYCVVCIEWCVLACWVSFWVVRFTHQQLVLAWVERVSVQSVDKIKTQVYFCLCKSKRNFEKVIINYGWYRKTFRLSLTVSLTRQDVLRNTVICSTIYLHAYVLSQPNLSRCH